MVRACLFSLFALLLLAFRPAPNDPVTWDMQLIESGDSLEVQLMASIEPGWYLYSQHLEDGGPIPTSFDFSDTEGAEFLGPVREDGALIEGFDDLFGMNIGKYAGTVTFKQALRVPNGTKTIRGSVEYMTCTETKCLPPRTLDIVLDLP